MTDFLNYIEVFEKMLDQNHVGIPVVYNTGIPLINFTHIFKAHDVMVNSFKLFKINLSTSIYILKQEKEKKYSTFYDLLGNNSKSVIVDWLVIYREV